MKNTKEYSAFGNFPKSLPIIAVSAVLILYFFILIYYKP